MSVEAWKTVFDVAAVTLLFLTFLAGAGVLFTGNIINQRQAGQLRQFDKDLTAAKKDLAEANARAEGFRLEIAKAVAGTATAQREAAEANTKAEGFRLDIAKANERSATLEKDAAAAKLETEKLKQVVAWRILPSEIAGALEKVLARRAGAVNLRYTDGDPESLFLAIQISQILEKAKWQVAPGAVKFSNAIQFGMALPDSAGADAAVLREAFTAAKIVFSKDPLPPLGVSFSISTIPGAPTLMIGSRYPIQIP